MRTFIALPLPEKARKALRGARDLLRAEVPGLSWVGEENWHLTLAFLGEQGEEGLAAARAALASISAPAVEGLPEPRLEIGHLATFPHRGPWRVLILGLAHTETLMKVYTVLNRALAEEAGKRGLPPLNPEWPRPWTPHITLARNRASREANASHALPSYEARARAEALLEAESGKGGWLFEAAMLYKSELRSGGAVYSELDRAFFGRF